MLAVFAPERHRGLVDLLTIRVDSLAVTPPFSAIEAPRPVHFRRAYLLCLGFLASPATPQSLERRPFLLSGLSSAAPVVATGQFAPVIAGIVGAVLGDVDSFWLGQKFGPLLPDIWPFRGHPERLTLGIRFFERYGGSNVFIGRFFGPPCSLPGYGDFFPEIELALEVQTKIENSSSKLLAPNHSFQVTPAAIRGMVDA